MNHSKKLIPRKPVQTQDRLAEAFARPAQGLKLCWAIFVDIDVDAALGVW
jgi:hypothetical protein